MKKIRLLFIVAALGVFSSLVAQTRENPWNVGVYFVKTEYLGDLRVYDNPYTTSNQFNKTVNTIFNFDMFYPGVGLSFDRYLCRFFDLGVYGSYSSIGYDYTNSADESHRNFRSVPLWNANLHTRFKFLGQDDARFVPYLTLGFGGLLYRQIETQVYAPYDAEESSGSVKYTNSKDGNNGFAAIFTGGIGFEYKITSKLSARYQADFGLTNQDEFDFMDKGGNDWQLQHNLGLTYSFGSPKDSDKDGVPDKLDKCPNTPAGVKVDVNGCPVDSDNDGVADYLDKCADTPAGVKVDANGCPVDSDNDGVADYLDKCPNTPAGVKVDANGCPVDTDKDGVADYLDKCPNTPANVKVDANGCPVDTDGDGIADYLDKCPTQKGPAENNGCPVVTERAKQAFQKALHGIQFETGKYTIKQTSNSVLNEIAEILKENPDYQVDINGHTDNVGKPDKNMTLSKERANAVKNYLASKGIAESRMKAEGFGDTKPVADNKTTAGKAENRRVEFVVNFER